MSRDIDDALTHRPIPCFAMDLGLVPTSLRRSSSAHRRFATSSDEPDLQAPAEALERVVADHP